VRICGATKINFRSALRWLRARWGVTRLLVEGGGELNAALFAAGLVDELHLTVCPKVFGGRTAPTIADGWGAQQLADAAHFTLKSARRVADEMFLVYVANHGLKRMNADPI
jgi:riboflavin biosynthesis pyrimidine reductase